MEAGWPPDSDGAPLEPGPTALNTTSFGSFLEVAKDKLHVRYTGKGAHSNDVGAIQGNRTVPRQQAVYYYEVTVLDAGERGCVAVGFGDQAFKLGRQPGWEPNSYGYHGDNGRKYCSSGRGEEYGPAFATGDTVGAGIDLSRQQIFFTKNGRHLGVAFHNVVTLPLLPTIGLHSRGEYVSVNFGQKPFKYDLEGWIQEEREREHAAISSVEMAPSAAQAAVVQYLALHGYADTLAALEAAPPGEAPSLANGHCMEAGSSNGLRAQPLERMGLLERSRVRRAILDGDPTAALAMLRNGGGAGARLPAGVEALLQCQQLIELIRQHRVEEAVAFAQQTLAHVQGHQTDHLLHHAIALLAYPEPEVSPLAHLISPAQRDMVADVANAAMLAGMQAGAPQQDSLPQAALERLLRHLAVVRQVLHETSGDQGEVFRLQEHLQSRLQ